MPPLKVPQLMLPSPDGHLNPSAPERIIRHNGKHWEVVPLGAGGVKIHNRMGIIQLYATASISPFLSSLPSAMLISTVYSVSATCIPSSVICGLPKPFLVTVFTVFSS